MQEELDDVCGSSLPELAHRAKYTLGYLNFELLTNNSADLVNYSLPYTDAVLMEVQRIITIAPVTAPHRALKETKLLGYTIPKVHHTDISNLIKIAMN